MRCAILYWVAVVALTVQHPATARDDVVMAQGSSAGRQSVQTLAGGSVRARYTYNDRDHGDDIEAVWTLDAAGVPTRYEARGNDYMKAPVDERFALRNGTARWKNRNEEGEQAVDSPAFYLPLNPPPEYYGVLARALLQARGHRLNLLPAGTAQLDAAGTLDIHAGCAWTEYRIAGLDFAPSSVWLDCDRSTAAVGSTWLATIASDRTAELSRVLERQDDTSRLWFARLAQALTQTPKGGLLIRNARLFDPRDLSLTSGTSILIRGERIVRVAPDAAIEAPAGTELLDARGRFVMPGLWDNHQHFDGVDGLLDIANGVTSARDMANDTSAFVRRVERFDAGTEIGPRVIKAGIIDGPGPYAAPTRMLAETAQQAIDDVDWYADHGYAQIKIYMSIKPALVPLIADRAHARGLRVSGHVPAFMSARQFIEAGADEIQHFNYVELNFLFPRVQETTHLHERFIEVGKHAVEFAPEKPEVQAFIAFLKQHHTVLDPTIGLLEARLAGAPGRITPGLEPVAARLPVQVRRAMIGGAYEAPAGHEGAYREAIPSMLRLLKAMHDAGITIVPGTDLLAGYQLHHELELYARAGIAPAQVLRMATLTSAQVMGVDGSRGVVAAGKLADLILIDGDPSTDIRDVRNVAITIKAGKIFDAHAIEDELGIGARKAAQR
ncbi:MAG: amidohydrolase family protein [Dokdonella sp.]